MTQQKVFETHSPEQLAYLHHFTGPEGHKAVRIEPWSQERDESRLSAVDGNYLGIFHDQSFYICEPVNLYLDKDMAKELKKASYVWITKDEESSYSLTLHTKNATKSFKVECSPNEKFLSIDYPVQSHYSNAAAVSRVRLAADALDHFRFSKIDTLELYFAGDAAPILVHNSRYENFYGLCMPIQFLEEFMENQELPEEVTTA